MRRRNSTEPANERRTVLQKILHNNRRETREHLQPYVIKVNVFCLHLNTLPFPLWYWWSSNKELIFFRETKDCDLLTPLLLVGFARNRLRPWESMQRGPPGPPGPPLPIAEAQMCHQCVIEHTSSRPEATGPPPPLLSTPSLPRRMSGRRAAFTPILWNGAENRGTRDTPRSVYQSRVCSADLLWNFI